MFVCAMSCIDVTHTNKDATKDTTYVLFTYYNDTINQDLSVNFPKKDTIYFKYSIRNKKANTHYSISGVAGCDITDDNEIDIDKDESYFSNEYRFDSTYQNGWLKINIRIETDTLYRARIIANGSDTIVGCNINSLDILRIKSNKKY